MRVARHRIPKTLKKQPQQRVPVAMEQDSPQVVPQRRLLVNVRQSEKSVHPETVSLPEDVPIPDADDLVIE